MAEVAREVAEFYQPVAELSGVRVVVDARTKAKVAGDPLLLSQAMSHLIENALKYGASGGEVALTVRERDGSVDIAVADRGPGIGEEERSKVTARFYRGNASRGTPGVGLGLTLVAAVARLHGGRLDFADNHPGLRAALSVAGIAVGRPARPVAGRAGRGRETAIA